MSRLIISNDSGGTCADHVNCVHLRRRLTCIPYPSPARLPPRLCRCQCLRALLDLGSSCVAVVCLCPSEFHYNLQQGDRLSLGICSILLAMVCRCPSDVANRCERSWHKDWWCPYWEPSDWDPIEWFHFAEVKPHQQNRDRPEAILRRFGLHRCRRHSWPPVLLLFRIKGNLGVGPFLA